MADVTFFTLRGATVVCYDDIYFKPDKFGAHLGEALSTSSRPTILDFDGATLNPAELTHPLHESGRPCTPVRNL
jgi:hypothetical protein